MKSRKTRSDCTVGAFEKKVWFASGNIQES